MRKNNKTAPAAGSGPEHCVSGSPGVQPVEACHGFGTARSDKLGNPDAGDLL